MNKRSHSEQIAVIICAYGDVALTFRVVGDLMRESDLVRIVVVDNAGTYFPIADEDVLRPGSNLGWLRGCNLGLEYAQESKHSMYILLNNDTRLSFNFVQNLWVAQQLTGAALLAPVYNGAWAHQRTAFVGPPSDYMPAYVHREVPFVDGTCMCLPAKSLEREGLLDDVHFARYGWGADLDYALRVRRSSGTVIVTEAAYVEHVGAMTARQVHGHYQRYRSRAMKDMVKGLGRKYGADWRKDAAITDFDLRTRGLLWHMRRNARQNSRAVVRWIRSGAASGIHD